MEGPMKEPIKRLENIKQNLLKKKDKKIAEDVDGVIEYLKGSNLALNFVVGK